MRVLTMNEMAEVSGGAPVDAFIGNMGQIIHEGGMALLVPATVFGTGFAFGTAAYGAFERYKGQSFGSWLYDKTH